MLSLTIMSIYDYVRDGRSPVSQGEPVLQQAVLILYQYGSH